MSYITNVVGQVTLGCQNLINLHVMLSYYSGCNQVNLPSLR